jgi:hypothetical protein
MMLKSIDFCPPVDALTLLQFRSDAYQAWCRAPRHQNHWLTEYLLIGELLDQAADHPVSLNLR